MKHAFADSEILPHAGNPIKHFSFFLLIFSLLLVSSHPDSLKLLNQLALPLFCKNLITHFAGGQAQIIRAIAQVKIYTI